MRPIYTELRTLATGNPDTLCYRLSGSLSTMGFDSERPEVGEVAVSVPTGDGGKEERRGADLDDVLRVILWDIAEAAGWGQNETARRLGVPQSTLSDVMSSGKGARVNFLSRICAAMKLDPAALFQSFERYAPESRGSVRFVEDAVYDRFRTLLTVDQARRTLAIFDRLHATGSVDAAIELLEKKLEVDAGVKPRA